MAGERYVYKFICDPRSLFSLAGFGGDNTAAALHYHAAAAAAISYPGMHPGHPLQPVRYYIFTWINDLNIYFSQIFTSHGLGVIWVPFHCRDLEIKLRFNGTHITLEWVKPTQFQTYAKNKMGPPLLHLLSSIKCFLLDHMTSSRHVIQAKIFLMIVSYIYKCAF